MKGHEIGDDKPVGLTWLRLIYARPMETESTLADFDVTLDKSGVPPVPWGRHRGSDPTFN